MPETQELTPEQLDQERRDETLREMVEQGGLDPMADNPFSASEAKAKQLTPEEVAKITLAHDYRDAKKLDFLFNRGDINKIQIKDASAKEVQSMIRERFDPGHKLSMRPEDPSRPDRPVIDRVEPKEIGHYAEDAIVQILNESGLKIQAELGSDYVDHLGKADIVLFIPTQEGDVCLKIQAKTFASDEELANLPANALLVELKNIRLPASRGARRPYASADVVQLAKKGNLGDKRNFASEYLQQVLDVLKASPRNVYHEAKVALGLI